MSRTDLEERWRTLTRELLPAVAASRQWPIRNDHCFQRVLLDSACGGRWYDRIEGRPAYRHAPDAVLSEAVRIGQDVLAGEADLSQLNRRSLEWRGKC